MAGTRMAARRRSRRAVRPAMRSSGLAGRPPPLPLESSAWRCVIGSATAGAAAGVKRGGLPLPLQGENRETRTVKRHGGVYRVRSRAQCGQPHLLAVACLLLCALLPAAAVSDGTQDGSQRWGYVKTLPGINMFWLWYRSPQKISTPAKPWPTVLWLQGGPGGSAVGHGNFLEIGPLDVNLKPRQWTWLKVADLIFVDAPVGVGYSYTEDQDALVKTDSQAVVDLAVVLEELLKKELPSMKKSPLYIVGESYGGKLAAMLGVSVSRAIRAGTLKLNLGGVVLGDSWISPSDFSLSYAQLLHYASRLNDNAVADVNKMAVMVKEQMLAGQYATARQTFTDQLDLIDSQSDSVNINNFLLDTGMNPVLMDGNLKTNTSLQRTTEEPGSVPNNTIDGDMNGPIKKMFKIIPKGLM
ncbi:unnamed protein product [Urochloa humidicola]